MESATLEELQWRATHGGRNQRALAQQALLERTCHRPVIAAPRDPKFDCELTGSLVVEWAWGALSANKVQHLAALAVADQTKLLQRVGASLDYIPSSLKALAAIGDSGKYPGNCHRDLLSYLGEPNIPKAFRVPIHIKIIKPRKNKPQVQQVPVSMLLPHELFHHMYTHNYAKFVEVYLGGDEGKVKEFWDGVELRQDPRLADHPMCRDHPLWRTRGVPLSFHGDAVPCLAVGKAGTKSLDVWSTQSVLVVQGGSLNLKNYVASMFQHNKLKKAHDEFDTEDEMGDVVYWSLRALYKGKWPTHDHKGKAYPVGSAEAIIGDTDLAGGYFALIWLIKSDLDYVGNYLHLRHYGSNEPCDHCPCSITGPQSAWPSNFGPDSSWIPNLFTPEQWRALYTNVPHWLFLFEFLSNLNVEPDELHVIHLGTSMWFMGSVLWMLVFRVLEGSAENNMGEVWSRISAAYSILNPAAQYTNLGLGSFCDPSKPSGHFPKLKGKGAEVKGLVGPLLLVWQSYMSPDNEEHQLIAHALQCVLDFQTIIDESGHELFLPQDEATKLKNHVDDFLKAYTIIGHMAEARGDLLYNMTTKFHMLWHLADRAKYLCPRRSACLIDEDFVGRTKEVAQASSAGTQLHIVPEKLTEKMRWGKSLL